MEDLKRLGTAIRKARLRLGWSQAVLARQLVDATEGVDSLEQATVSKWERGEHLPSIDVRPTLRRLLGPEVARLLDAAEMHAFECSPGKTPAKRQDASAGLLADVNHSPGSALIASAQPLDGEYVNAVSATIRQLLALGSQFGGDELSGLATRFFWSVHRRLWSDTYDPTIERDLRAAAGELGEVAGWFLYDANEQAAARHLNHEALLLSRLAGDRKMALLTLQNMSMQAGYLNRPREALALARGVLSSGRLSTRVNALFHAREARALAQSKERSAALAGFAHARTLFLDGVSDDDPPWIYWVDESEFAWHEAMCHADLDNWGRAVELFHQAVEGCVRDRARSRFHYLACLLKALVETEAWRDAEVAVEETLPYVGEVGSGSTAVLLQGVAERIDTMKASPSLRDAAHHLRHRLNTTRGV